MAHDNVFGIRENKCMVEVLPKSNTYSKAEVYNKNEVADEITKAILPVGAIVLSQVGANGEWFGTNGWVNMGNIVVKDHITGVDEVFTLWRRTE